MRQHGHAVDLSSLTSMKCELQKGDAGAGYSLAWLQNLGRGCALAVRCSPATAALSISSVCARLTEITSNDNHEH